MILFIPLREEIWGFSDLSRSELASFLCHLAAEKVESNRFPLQNIFGLTNSERSLTPPRYNTSCRRYNTFLKEIYISPKLRNSKSLFWWLYLVKNCTSSTFKSFIFLNTNITIPVTRLDDFLTFLAINCLSKVAEMFVDFWGILSKNCRGLFLGQL